MILTLVILKPFQVWALDAVILGVPQTNYKSNNRYILYIVVCQGVCQGVVQLGGLEQGSKDSVPLRLMLVSLLFRFQGYLQ